MLEKNIREVCIHPLTVQKKQAPLPLGSDVIVDYSMAPLPKGFNPGIIIPLYLTHNAIWTIGGDGNPAEFSRSDYLKPKILSKGIVKSYEGILKKCLRQATGFDVGVRVSGEDIILSYNDSSYYHIQMHNQMYNNSHTIPRQMIVKGRRISQKAHAAEDMILNGASQSPLKPRKFSDNRPYFGLGGYLLLVDDLGFSVIDEGIHE